MAHSKQSGRTGIAIVSIEDPILYLALLPSALLTTDAVGRRYRGQQLGGSGGGGGGAAGAARRLARG
eukprot:scaffold48252_cov49-Phaeocystis_antarctica.AAC.5